MGAWSIAPWLIALAAAAALGGFGWFTDFRSKHRSGDDPDQGPSRDDA